MPAMISFSPKFRDGRPATGAIRRHPLGDYGPEAESMRDATKGASGHDWSTSSLDLRAGLDVTECDWAETMPADLGDLPKPAAR